MEKKCDLCHKVPVVAITLKNFHVECSCGNHIYVYETPALYIGVIKGKHYSILAFPGCMACGRPINSPFVIATVCKNAEDDIKLHLQPIYHNDGLRN